MFQNITQASFAFIYTDTRWQSLWAAKLIFTLSSDPVLLTFQLQKQYQVIIIIIIIKITLLGWHCRIPAAGQSYSVIKSHIARRKAKSSQCVITV